MTTLTPDQTTEALELLREVVDGGWIVDNESMRCIVCDAKWQLSGQTQHASKCWHTRAQPLLAAIESEAE